MFVITAGLLSEYKILHTSRLEKQEQAHQMLQVQASQWKNEIHHT